MIWGQFFVVVGMSFECRIDKFLLTMLNKVEDDLPIGESTWLLINPDEMSLEQSALRIQSALPSAIIHKIPYKFDDWINSRMPQLQDAGVLSF